jgi:hypothetical protein
MKKTHEDQKSVVVAGPTAEQMWADFSKRYKVLEQPAGTLTIRQYAEKFGISYMAAARLLETAVENGEATMEKLRIAENGVQSRETRVFALIPKALRKPASKTGR